MRAHYETEKDLKAEWTVACYAGMCWNFDPEKQPKGSRVDFKAKRHGELVAWFEVKCRKHALFHYPTFFINRSKIDAGLLAERQSGKPFFLIIGFSDGVFYLRVKRKLILKTELGGRNGERPVMMAHFNPKLFRPVK